MEGSNILSERKRVEGYHRSVLLKEVVDALKPVPSGAGRDAWFLDATLGDGGHTIGLLRAGGKIFGIDSDPQALLRTRQRLDGLGIDKTRFKLVQGNFRDLKELISLKRSDPKCPTFKGVLFDLGVSSLQLKDPKRGFSFDKVGPLDMRMDPALSVSALDLVNGLNKGELYELFTKLGEEKLARPIAAALVLAREVAPVQTTKELVDLVIGVCKKYGVRSGKIHPATRVFQALRMAVNDELNALKEALPQALEVTQRNGNILVVSFHSLEDRIVKDTFLNWQSLGLGQVLTKKPVIPGLYEIRDNPRSRSAKLRIFKKA